MRNMSFMLTTDAIKNKTKTVTRRTGWGFLIIGDMIKACKKCQGLKRGEKIEVISIIRVSNVRKETLREMTNDVEYGVNECKLEGFENHPEYKYPSQFVKMFCASHKGCRPDTIITRIEFEYILDCKETELSREN